MAEPARSEAPAEAAAFATAATAATSEAPYPGLRPFRREESDIFFGREGMVDELVRRLTRSRFLGIDGVSGCGKSSLLRAGLIPALETGFLAEAGVHWKVAEMRPGNRPLHALARALAPLLPSDASAGADCTPFIEDSLRRGPRGVDEVLQEHEFPHDVNLMLLVDQFEEIFRYRREGDPNEADAFVALLLETARQSSFRVFVILAMRSDYLGDCAVFTGLPEALNDSQFLVPRLNRELRREAIEGPAGVFGARIQPVLVNQLLNDMGADPDQLPVMQHLLMRMWQRAGGGTRSGVELTLEDYAAVGGFSQALSRHADEAFDSLKDPAEQRIAEVLFRCATERLTDKQDSRRPVRIREVADVAGVPWQSVAAVVDVFRRADNSFLVPPEGVPLDERTIVDITHESLIRQWHRLSEWVRDEALRAERYRKIRDDAEEWSQRAKARVWLLRSPELDDALAWRKEAKPTGAWAMRYGGNFDVVREFLEKSVRRRAVTRALTWSAIGLMVLLAAAAVWRYQRYLQNEAVRAQKQADWEAQQKQEKQNIALAYDLAAQANLIRGLKLGLLQTSTLLAVEAANRFPSLQVNQTLRDSLRLLPVRTLFQRGIRHPASIRFTPDGRQLLVGEGGTLQSIDVGSGEVTRPWTCDGCTTGRVSAFSPNGRYLAVSTDKEIRVVDRQSNQQIGQSIAAASIKAVEVGSDGRVSAIADGRARRMSPADRRHASSSMWLPVVRALSPDTRYVALWVPPVGRVGGHVEVQSLEDGKAWFTWELGDAEVRHLAFSPDSGYLAAATQEGLVRVWSLASGVEVRRFAVPNYAVQLRDLYLGWNASHIVVVAREATRVFDLQDASAPREVARIEGFGILDHIAMSPDGRLLAASGRSGLRMWQLTSGGEVARFVSQQPVNAVAMSPDKKLVATASPVDATDAGKTPQGEVSVWNVESGRKLLAHRVAGPVSQLRFSEDSTMLLVGSGGRAVVRVAVDPTAQPPPVRRATDQVGGEADDAQYGVRADQIELDCGPESRVAGFSGDGRRVAVQSARDLCIFDVTSATPVARLTGARGPVSLSRTGDSVALLGLDRRVRWANLGRRAATSSAASTAQASEALDASALTPLLRATAPARALVLSSKGSYLALSTLKPGVSVHGAMVESPMPRIAHDSSVDALAFSNGETFLASGGKDTNARVWDISAEGEVAKEVARFSYRVPVTAVTFSDDDEYLVTASDKVVRVLQWRTPDLINAACDRLSRTLTRDEWAQYFPGFEYAPKCSGPSGSEPGDEEGAPLERAAERLVQGQVVEAIALYRQAELSASVKPYDWNQLCWSGSLLGFAEEVLFACDNAVQGAPDKPTYRDSRGLAKALAGQPKDAADDLRIAVEASGSLDEKKKAQRRRWIEALERGDDPFTVEEIRALRDYSQ